MNFNKLSVAKLQRIKERLIEVKLFIMHPDQIIYYMADELIPSSDISGTIDDLLNRTDKDLVSQKIISAKKLAKLKTIISQKLRFYPADDNPILTMNISNINQLMSPDLFFPIHMLPIKKMTYKFLRQNSVEQLRDLLFLTNRQLNIALGGDESIKIIEYLNNIKFSYERGC